VTIDFDGLNHLHKKLDSGDNDESGYEESPVKPEPPSSVLGKPRAPSTSAPKSPPPPPRATPEKRAPTAKDLILRAMKKHAGELMSVSEIKAFSGVPSVHTIGVQLRRLREEREVEKQDTRWRIVGVVEPAVVPKTICDEPNCTNTKPRGNHLCVYHSDKARAEGRPRISTTDYEKIKQSVKADKPPPGQKPPKPLPTGNAPEPKYQNVTKAEMDQMIEKVKAEKKASLAGTNIELLWETLWQKMDELEHPADDIKVLTKMHNENKLCQVTVLGGVGGAAGALLERLEPLRQAMRDLQAKMGEP
jgi:hypothetical protein